MSEYEQIRTWTATIQAQTRSGMVVLDAERSRWDLLQDQTQAAVREAMVLLEEGEVSVVLHKTTNL